MGLVFHIQGRGIHCQGCQQAVPFAIFAVIGAAEIVNGGVGQPGQQVIESLIGGGILLLLKKAMGCVEALADSFLGSGLTTHGGSVERRLVVGPNDGVITEVGLQIPVEAKTQK